jgi:hypothetical protein
MNLFRTSAISGLCLASLHFSWIVLVALGWAQPFMDFIFKLHMLNSPLQVQPFDIVLGIGLLLITFLIGCFYGLIFYLVKNRISN